MSINSLWVESHRPDTLEGYVFKDEKQKMMIESWIKEGSIPHLLFSGRSGIGKTTLALILIKAIGVIGPDLLQINASRENSVDAIRNKITNFVSTMPFGDFKVVLLDEADYISPAAQAALRGVMETYSESARFILTCNYPQKIIPAIHGRCQGFHFEKLDDTEFLTRAAEILINEDIEFELEDLEAFVKATYPDLRKCINLLQMHSVDKKLLPNTETTSNSTDDVKLKVVEYFKQGRVREAREHICNNFRNDEIEELFRWMYDNLDLWSDTEEGQDKAILIIRNAIVNSSFVADQEINLAACMCELASIGK